jgi:erythronate-4-phosphate dehydrogenase
MQYVASALATLSVSDPVSLKGLTLGIIGAGHIGTKVARLAQMLGMRVLLNDPPRARREGSSQFTELKQLLAATDILSLHVPLNMAGIDRTYHLLDGDTIKTIKKPFRLLNTSRGPVVDGKALAEALRTGHIKDAVIDVWEKEPHINQGLLPLVRLATPHIAGYSADGKATATAMVTEAVSRFFAIGPVRPVTGVPPPATPHITIDCRGKTAEEILKEAILATYHIEDDDRQFRASPGTFEAQRDHYHVRREFPAYTVTLEHPVKNIGQLLSDAGFRLSQKL